MMYPFMKQKVIQMKVTPMEQVGIGTFFGNYRESNNTSGTSSTLGGDRIESTNTPKNKAKVQNCEGIFPWKILQHNKSVVLCI